MRGLKRLLWTLAVLVVVAAAAGAWWYYAAPRELTVTIFPDFAYRQRSDWKELLKSRIAEVSRIYESQTGLRWKIASIEPDDPINASTDTLDNRRAELAHKRRYGADLLLIVSGSRDGNRLGSVTPFSHAALVVDFTDRSELRNVVTMAHELAHICGAPDEPGTDTLMAPDPRDTRFSARAAKLIHRLRRYDFAQGVDGLQSWGESSAVSALADADRGLFPNPLSQAHQSLALSLANDARYADAIRQQREAVKLEPREPKLRCELAQMLLQNSEVDNAIQALRDGVRVTPDNARLHAMLAAALSKRDREEAIEEYLKAARLDPQNAAYQEVLGSQLVLGMGRVDDAIAAFQEAIRLDPGMVKARDGLIKAQQLKETALADVARLSREAGAARTNWKLYYELGVAESRAANFDGASRAFTKAAELDPRAAQVHTVMALMHYIHGDFAAASAELNRASELGMPPRADFVAALKRKMGPQ
jgi:tetratricopeptide (TPR) repeat protein